MFEQTKNYGPLKQFVEVCSSKPFSLAKTYTLEFMESDETKHVGLPFNEEAVYKSIYTDEKLFTAIGVEGCVVLDQGCPTF